MASLHELMRHATNLPCTHREVWVQQVRPGRMGRHAPPERGGVRGAQREDE